MSQRTALITGANGDVGQALCATFRGAGWKIIATDQGDTAGSPVDAYHAVELARLCRDTTYQAESSPVCEPSWAMAACICSSTMPRPRSWRRSNN